MKYLVVQVSIWFFIATQVCAQSADSTSLVKADSASVVEEAVDTLTKQLTTKIPPKDLSWRAVAIPSAMIAYGTLTFASDWLQDVNVFGRKQISGTDSSNRRTTVDNYTMHVPAVAILGLNIAGVKGRHNLFDATLLFAMSSGLGNGLVFPLKSFTKTVRPDSSEYNSFPSGHAAQAFVAAECLRLEYKDVNRWIGRAGYGMAILTSYLRMYNNRHWFSDVIAGAGVGILVTRFSYFVYPTIKNAVISVFERDKSVGYDYGRKQRKRRSSAMILPGYSNGNLSLQAVYRF